VTQRLSPKKLTGREPKRRPSSKSSWILTVTSMLNSGWTTISCLSTSTSYTKRLTGIKSSMSLSMRIYMRRTVCAIISLTNYKMTMTQLKMELFTLTQSWSSSQSTNNSLTTSYSRSRLALPTILWTQFKLILSLGSKMLRLGPVPL
jgi:hypothetical protein